MNTKEFTERYYVDRRGTWCYKWDSPEEQGKDHVISMSVADMDFKVPEAVTEAMIRRVEHGAFGYTITPDPYLEAFITWEKERHQVEIEKEWIRFSPGIVTGIYWCIQAFTQPGDAVIINTPVYYPFHEAILDLKRKLVRSELVPAEGRYTVDFEDFERKIVDEDVKMFILCSPHNPVGRVWKEKELEQLFDICGRHGVMIIADEIHQDFVYSGHTHISSLNVENGKYKENVILMASASKTFNLAGLKNSFVVIPSEEKRKVFDAYEVSPHVDTACLMSYVAVEAAYRCGVDWLEDLLKVIWENYEYAKNTFEKELPESIVTPLEGTYLFWVDLGAYVSADEIVDLVQEKARVVPDFGNVFSDKCGTFIRLNLATSMENVEKAVNAVIMQIRERGLK